MLHEFSNSSQKVISVWRCLAMFLSFSTEVFLPTLSIFLDNFPISKNLFQVNIEDIRITYRDYFILFYCFTVYIEQLFSPNIVYTLTHSYIHA